MIIMQYCIVMIELSRIFMRIIENNRLILRNNRRMFWEILNRKIGRKYRIIIGTGLEGKIRLGTPAPIYSRVGILVT